MLASHPANAAAYMPLTNGNRGSALKVLHGKNVIRPNVELARALNAVFGRRKEMVVRTADGDVIYEHPKLLNTPVGRVLVAAGRVDHASHGQGGVLGVWYLRHSGGQIAVGPHDPAIVQTGSFGEISLWFVLPQSGTDALIQVNGDIGSMGEDCSFSSLVALSHGGPKLLKGGILVSYDRSLDDPAREAHWNGRLTITDNGKRLIVIYRGTSPGRVSYHLRDGFYQLEFGQRERVGC